MIPAMRDDPVHTAPQVNWDPEVHPEMMDVLVIQEQRATQASKENEAYPVLLHKDRLDHRETRETKATRVWDDLCGAHF